jgi:hypothetical protein
MGLIKVEKVLIVGFKNKFTNKIHLQCDECGKEYICKLWNKARALNEGQLHFCSRQCLNLANRSDGILRKKTTQVLFDIYGTTSFFDTDEFKRQQEEFCLEKYGVKSRLESMFILEKIKETCLQKYGQETYAGSDDWESKIDRNEIVKKAWLTKIKNGSCSKSGPEEKLNEILVAKFGSDNVQRQVSMLRQWVDFYVLPLNLYIQVDGVYWHGLNRNIEIIKLGKTSQDKKIYKQILRDEKLNKYMKENNMKLIRITDDEIKSLTKEEILYILNAEK